MPDRPDMDEKFSLDMEPEEVIKKLLGDDEADPEDTEPDDSSFGSGALRGHPPLAPVRVSTVCVAQTHGRGKATSAFLGGQ